MKGKAKKGIFSTPESPSEINAVLERFAAACASLEENGMSPQDLKERFESVSRDHEGLAATPDVVLRLVSLVDALTAEANDRLGIPRQEDELAEFERLCRNIHSAIVAHVAAGKDCAEIATRFRGLMQREVDNRCGKSRCRVEPRIFVAQAMALENELTKAEVRKVTPAAQMAHDFDRVQRALDAARRELGQGEIPPSDLPRLEGTLRELHQKALVALRPSFELSEAVANRVRVDNVVKYADELVESIRNSIGELRSVFDQKVVAMDKVLTAAREAVQQARTAMGAERSWDLEPIERRLKALEDEAFNLAKAGTIRAWHVASMEREIDKIHAFRGWVEDFVMMASAKSGLSLRALLRFHDAENAISLVERKVMRRLQSSVRVSPVVLERLKSVLSRSVSLWNALSSAAGASERAKSQGEEMLGVQNSANLLFEELDGLDETSPDNLQPVDDSFVAFVDFVQYLLPLGAEIVRIVMEGDFYEAEFKTAADAVVEVREWTETSDLGSCWRVIVGDDYDESASTFAEASTRIVKSHRKKYEVIADAVSTFDFGKDDGDGEDLGEACEEGEES